MYSLFQYDPKIEYGTVHLSEWTYLKDGLTRNLVTVLNHYRHNSYSVAADHLLVQLLQSINVPLSLSLDRYFANVNPVALSLASPFRLTSPINSGKIFNGTFYGKGNQEVLIAVDEWFDAEKVAKDWENITPVRVIRHPFSDLELNIPNGRIKSQEQGVVVVAINIALLAVQYRSFYYAELNKQKADPTYVPGNMMQFVYMFVLPNMLGSHLDYVLFNRISNHLRHIPNHKTRPGHPMMLTDYSRQVATVQLRMLEVLKRSNYSFGATLYFLPAVVRENMERALLVPDVAPTRAVLWALILARLPALLFLIDTAKYGTRMRNQKEADEIGETLARLKRQRVFDSVLPAELYEETMATIDEVVEKMKFTQIE